jgi:hypothetical protein
VVLPSRPLRRYSRVVGYPYEDLDDKQLERIVVQCMRKLFGAGVQSFATGPDGGRDALFVGTANLFPSAASPWTGTTIGQAKHTIATNAHFSDPDFSGDGKSSVLSKEIVRINKLVAAGEIDNYILFSNRRLGGTTGPKLVALLAETTGIAAERIFLAGIEYLDGLIDSFPEILVLANIDLVDGPLLVSSADLAEIILAITDELDLNALAGSADLVDRVSFDEKNELNAMTKGFATVLADRYLGYSAQIEEFLADPANAAILAQYETTVEDFQLKIIAKRKDHQSFDNVFNHLVDVLVKRNGVLGRNVALVRAVLFYMYWHCDIGMTPDAAAQ